MKLSTKAFFSKCDQETADLVIFTEKILNGKLHFLRSVCIAATICITCKANSIVREQNFCQASRIFTLKVKLGRGGGEGAGEVNRESVKKRKNRDKKMFR